MTITVTVMATAVVEELPLIFWMSGVFALSTNILIIAIFSQFHPDHFKIIYPICFISVFFFFFKKRLC